MCFVPSVIAMWCMQEDDDPVAAELSVLVPALERPAEALADSEAKTPAGQPTRCHVLLFVVNTNLP